MQGCSDGEVFYYLFIRAHKNVFMVLFEFPLSIWVLKFVVYIEVKIFFVTRRKIKLAEPSILFVSVLPELFWNGCFLSGSIVCLGFLCFFIFDFCACLCNVVSGDCLSSPII